ncbi:MAG: dihydroorotase, partial [Bacteroidota bacterium]
ALNLLGTVADVQSFDSHYKVLPPLRSEEDRKALIEGLQDGTIDCISSNHCPRELEAKQLEFAYADFGAAMLSTAFGALSTALRDYLEESHIVELLTKGPRGVLGLSSPSLEVGSKAEMSFYHYNEVWQPQVTDIGSKSKNAPLINRQLTGRPIGIVNGIYTNL